MASVLDVRSDAPGRHIIEQTGDILRSGGVAIVPTDSVYGIACAALPDNPGHRRIFTLKRRSRALTLPLLISSVDELALWAHSVSEAAYQLARAFWPGGLTLVVTASHKLPREYVRQDGTVALRVPACELVCELVQYVGVPLATTSANIHGKPAPASAHELDASLISGVDLTLNSGSTQLGIASTIVDVSRDSLQIVRSGAISAARIEEALRSGAMYRSGAAHR